MLANCCCSQGLSKEDAGRLEDLVLETLREVEAKGFEEGVGYHCLSLFLSISFLSLADIAITRLC